MKILIVDDSRYKVEEVIDILSRLGIEDYEVAVCVNEAVLKITSGKFDLMISDLGLPLQAGWFVENSLEGLQMFKSLSLRCVEVPTIVYSTTDIPEEDIIELDIEFDYPFIGQAKDRMTLKKLLQEYLERVKKEVEEKPIERKRFGIRIGEIKPWY